MTTEHKKYMRQRTDDELSELNRDEIIENLQKIKEPTSDANDLTTQELLLISKKHERTRHLMFWHDGSSLSNHGHLLTMVAAMYDPAVFLTDEEYYNKYSSKCNVQAAVESPYLYIVARCPANDQQLLYSDERIKDILELNNPILTEAGIPINDVAKMFKGDLPASQLEAG